MTRLFAASAEKFRRFSSSRHGGVAPLIGLIFLVIVGCMGMGIDTGRSMITKARLVDALDAAGLAVGARLETTDYNADAKRFVSANFKALYGGATVTSVTATPDKAKGTITLTATATMPTSFMRLFGVPVVTVNASSEITRQADGLELVIVLDNTGSMEVSSSMPSLKSAATGLVNDLFGSQAVTEDLFIGLVPFSQAVNIGTDIVQATLWTDLTKVSRKWFYTPPLINNWTGCVEARRNGLDQTDDPPNLLLPNTLFKTYYSPDSSQNNWIKTRFGVEYTDIYYRDYTPSGQQGPAAYCPQPMTPMTNTKSKIITGINNMKAAGSTMINLGAVWGWRMLSPSWRGAWGGDMAANSLPLNYGTKRMRKAMVLMTDGENSFGVNNYTAYGDLTEGRLGYTQQSKANAELDNRLTTVCNAMKAKDILILTVAYDNPPADTKALLQGCATNSSLYFDAASSSSLATAFKKIAGVLSSLRVSR